MKGKLKNLLCTIFLMGVMLLATGNTCYAEVDINALEGYLNGVVTQQSINQINNPKYANRSNTVETIDPITGNLLIQETDLSLPGKDGMDLSIGRVYNSAQDEFEKKVSVTSSSSSYTQTYTGYVVLVLFFNESNGTTYTNTIGTFTNYDDAADVYIYYRDNVVNCIPVRIYEQTSITYYTDYTITTKNYPDKYSYYKTRYNLGAGWSFSFPSVQLEDYNGQKYMYYHDETGAVYKVIGTSDTSGTNLDGYEGKDVKFIEDNGSYINGDNVSSKYKFIRSDKTVEYFAADGRILGIKDRFGNQIKFKHVNMQVYDKTYPFISQIEDSTGRIINFNYAGNNIILTVTAPGETEQINITYERYFLTKEATDNGVVIDTYTYPILFKVIDPIGRITYYEDYYNYNNNSHPNERYSYSTKALTDSSASADRYLLGSIIYAGTKTRYEYEKVLRNLGTEGLTDAYRVKARYDQFQKLDAGSQTPLDWNGNYNRIDYTYSGDYTGYPAYSGEEVTPETYEFWTESTALNGLKTKYTFNGVKQQIQKESSVSSNEKKVVKNLEFDSNYKFKPTKTELTEYAGDGTLASTLYMGMAYTEWGGLSSSTLPLTAVQYNDANTKIKYTTTYYYENSLFPYFVTKKQSFQNDTKLLTESYNYDSSGRLQSQINAKGEITNYHYYTDAFGNQIEEFTKPLEAGKEAKTKYIYGSETGYAYPKEIISYYTDEWGNATQTRTGKTYDMLLGLVRTETDNDYKTTSYIYDKLGRLVSKQLPGFSNNYGEYYTVTEEYSYTNAFNLDYLDGNGYLYGTTVESYTRYSNIDGSQSFYNIKNELYDVYGNLRNSQSFRDSRWVNTASYNYDSMMRVIASVDAEGNMVTAFYNPWGENNENIDALGNLYVSYYEIKSNQIKSYFVAKDNIAAYRTNPRINTYKENYLAVSLDQFGRIVSRTVYENWPVLTGELSELYQYDIAGNLIAYTDPKRNVNEDGYTKSYQYDELNQIIRVKDAINQITAVNYNALGEIAVVTLKDNESSIMPVTIYEKTYDELGNMTGKADTSGESATNFYNELGLNTRSTDRNGNINILSYDELNQLNSSLQIGADYTSTREYRYTYRNPFGYFDELKYENGTPSAQSHYFYDQSGQVIQKNVYTGNITSSLKLQYDDTGNIKSLGTGVFDSNYFYTNYGYISGRLTQVQTNGLTALSSLDSENATYEYYPDGKLKKLTYPKLNDGSLLTTEYAYNAIGRLVSVTNKKNSMVLSEYSYTYDANGNIITVQEDSTVKTYVYDKLNRLIEIQPEAGNSTNTIYTYDLRGNRLTLSSAWFDLNLAETEYAYDMQNNLKSVTKGNAIALAGNTADGLKTEENTITGSAVTVSGGAISSIVGYEKDEKQKINIVTGTAIHKLQETVITTMDYYADGLRAGKYTAAGSELYIYDLSGRLVAEAENSSVITANYIWGADRVLAKKETAGGEYYYLYNGHGDVVQIVDRNGNVVNNYKYDEWGNTLENSEIISNPFKYAGEVYDEETGLYYLKARYYDPALGRFINEDSYEGQVNNPLSLNVYAYGYNNPIGYIDSSGNIPVETIADIFSIAWSLNDFVKNPSWSNFGYLAWDVAATIVPYVPGSYTAKGLKAGAKILAKADDFEKTGVWAMKAFDRGYAIEKMLGGWGTNFPVIDKAVKGIKGYAESITSIKSMDITAKTYNKGNRMYYTLKGYIDSLSGFVEKRWANETISTGADTKRYLELAIPAVEMTKSQFTQLQKAIKYASDLENPVEIILRIIK